MKQVGTKPDTAFNSLDYGNKGYLTFEDFQNWLSDTNKHPNMKNLYCLFDRFDKDGDNLVSYHEFITGL